MTPAQAETLVLFTLFAVVVVESRSASRYCVERVP